MTYRNWDWYRLFLKQAQKTAQKKEKHESSIYIERFALFKESHLSNNWHIFNYKKSVGLNSIMGLCYYQMQRAVSFFKNCFENSQLENGIYVKPQKTPA